MASGKSEAPSVRAGMRGQGSGELGSVAGAGSGRLFPRWTRGWVRGA